jgi:multisubunit Na+/H+ antiporter MnhB subunit
MEPMALHATDGPVDPGARFLKPVAAGGGLLLFGAMAAAFHAFPPPGGALPRSVMASVPLSGVVNPVTAVVVNFRGYDTLIEIAVLLLTAVGARAAAGSNAAAPPAPQPEPMLAAFYRLLAPVVIVVAGYLLWVGKHAPGGAFQAGAMLGAVSILWRFCSGGPPPGEGRLQRLALCTGTILFCSVGVGAQLAAPGFLQYPVGWAGWLILLIETGCTLSIAAALTELFTACRST